MGIRAVKYSVLLVSLLFYASGMDINIPDMCEEFRFQKIYTNDTVRFVISNDPNELESYWSKYSSNVKCKIAVNFTKMIQSRRSKLVLKISLEPNIGTVDSCLFDVGLYLANSNFFVPVKTLHCHEVIDQMSLHWPEKEFVLGFKMRSVKDIITNRVFNMTISVTPETCDRCYTMIPKSYGTKSVTLKQPKGCGASSCIDFTASEHSLLSAYDFLHSYDHHQSTCSIFFSLKSPLTICIKVYRESRGLFDSIFTPATIVVLLDGKIYLNLSVKDWLNYWCMPKEWFQKKSQMEVRWSELDIFLSHLGQSSVYIRTNSSAPKSLSKCNSAVTYMTTTMRIPHRDYGTSRPYDHGSDTGYVDGTSNTFFAPVLGIVSFAAFIIGVCCLAAYVRSKNQRLIRNRRQRVNTARFTRNITDSTPRETFPNFQGARPAVDRTAFYTGQAAEPPFITYRPPELDLPPPYPGKAEPELPPPSYEESCVTISTNINRDK